MKLLQIVPRGHTSLYGAMIKKQAEIRKSGRGTFMRAGASSRKAARWTHVRYKGSLKLKPGESEAGSIGISATGCRRSTFNTSTERRPSGRGSRRRRRAGPAAHAAKRARSCGCRKSTGVPLGMMPVGLTRVIE